MFSGVLASQIAFQEFRKDKAPISQEERAQNIHFTSLLQGLPLKDTSGNEINLQSDKVVILNFWASWCAPCLKEFPLLAQLRKKFPEEELNIVAINTDFQKQLFHIKRIENHFSLNINHSVDFDNEVSSVLEIASLPLTLVLKSGEVVKIFQGQTDFMNSDFLELIENLVN